jgi:hypothetical protein
MNISETEAPARLVAKTCSCGAKDKNKMTYEFIDSYHSLCFDKKDIIYTEIEASACLHEGDKKTIESEITELKMAVDLLSSLINSATQLHTNIRMHISWERQRKSAVKNKLILIIS